MKILAVFYSRTGHTKKVAEEIANNLKADIEEIVDKKNRKGVLCYLSGGKDASTKKLTKIKVIKKEPSNYDLVIIGTPIWALAMTPAVRTYITNNKFNKVAFFCTQGSSGAEKTFKEMEELTKKPVAVLSLLTAEVGKEEYKKMVKGFCDRVKK